MAIPIVTLKRKKEASIQRKHPWIFSGAIERILIDDNQDDLTDGELVKIVANNGDFLALGHFHHGSIAVRVVSFEDIEPSSKFWEEKVTNAINYRKILGLIDSSDTNTYRLIHGEGDGFSGLIVDIYDDVAVYQAHSIGMHKVRNEIANAIVNVLNGKIKTVYDKSSETLPPDYAATIENSYLIGEHEGKQLVKEHGITFEIDWVSGQKTGFFIDQRENRKLLQKYVEGKKLLNTFCYSGGFSIYALQAGAEEVHSLDSSEKAIALTDRNVAINFQKKSNHKSIVADTITFLNKCEEDYDVIILDPPAYAKNRKSLHNAIQGYKRLNARAFKMMKKGGVLLTFSCSQVVDRQTFYNTIMAAAIESGRNVRVMEHLSQPADHPVSMYHPEGAYLKGLVVYVD
jgi:23S rRNA (cytosine1962-C5)-methyltransferase